MNWFELFGNSNWLNGLTLKVPINENRRNDVVFCKNDKLRRSLIEEKLLTFFVLKMETRTKCKKKIFNVCINC